jgi:Uma2 family endonuclease
MNQTGRYPVAHVEMTTELPFKPPPRGEDLPHDDGEPMESARHLQQMWLLIHSLQDAWRDRDDVYVAGNMFIYFSELQARNHDFRGPDVFVVMDTVNKERKSWVVWEEDGRTPDLVIEIVSPSTEHADRGDKMRIYATILHVAEYYLFDPFTGALDAYELDASRRSYRRREPDADGRFASPVTGLALGVVPGRAGGIEAGWLRWIGPDGAVIPDRGEREAARADSEAVRARAEAERAEEALRRVAELERQLGKM